MRRLNATNNFANPFREAESNTQFGPLTGPTGGGLWQK
jgi:hypothetical protein